MMLLNQQHLDDTVILDDLKVLNYVVQNNIIPFNEN